VVIDEAAGAEGKAKNEKRKTEEESLVPLFAFRFSFRQVVNRRHELREFTPFPQRFPQQP